MKIVRIPAAGFSSSCWLLWNEMSGEAAIVDPSVNVQMAESFLAQRQLTLKWILLTHGHFDHIFSLDLLRERFGAQAAIHAADADMLSDSIKNASALFLREDHSYAPAERILSDGDTIALGTETIRVISAPGHTLGSVLYECGDILLTGDVLFDGSVGRTDLPGGDAEVMHATLVRLKKMKDHRVYPGHGGETTLGKQQRTNPFFDYL